MTTRRDFLRTSAVAATFLSLPARATAAARRVRRETLRVAVIGFRSRGRALRDAFAALPDVEVVALCDVDDRVLAEGERWAADRGREVALEKDVRRVLDRDDVHAVATATPNHWHALVTVWACQAGKDVYVEKPVSHDVWEGRQMVRAAAKYGRVVQTGTQMRSSGAVADALAWTREGGLGAIRLARGLCYKPRASIGKVDGPQAVDPAIDYDLWTGPAALRPLRRRSLHYDWHWDFETGNGDLGNQGIHQMDACRWAIGADALPTGAVSVGGRLGYDDDGNTPNTQLVLLDYAPAPILFEVRGLPHDRAAQTEDWGGRMDDYRGVRIGVIVHCEGGWLRIPNYDSAIAYDADGRELRRWQGASNHVANFVDAVRERDPSRLTAPIEDGHLSSALCHLGNASYRMKAELGHGEDEAPASDVLDEALARMREHLERNEVDPDRLLVGPHLSGDLEPLVAEGRRTPREPFVVPEEV